MKELDRFSYACGVIDAFNEVVRAGVKRMALAHPCPSREERDSYLPFAEKICSQYGTRCYAEDEPLLTDLFPVTLNRGTYNLIFYKNESDLEEYLALKAQKARLCAAGAYRDEARREIAEGFGRLLSYTDEAIGRLIEENKEKEII
ncbi:MULTISPECIES: hypothetical protein [Oscillospiraceae]|uniref:hypothetical protein n=1 Tax=Oscillospiraceae TaxID=216572 RepID=UPI0009A6585B|nr:MULTISPECIES: hypothetical protein [Oscillospiraceae]